MSTKNSVKLIPRQEYALGVLKVTTPDEVISNATGIATSLAKIIKDKKLAKQIQGREYVQVEGWTTLGAMLGVTPRHLEELSKQLSDGGFQETVELVRINDGFVIGRATAICGVDEKDRNGKSTWGSRPVYARKSMAITRATGKAYRLAFSWIMVLAGYEATPAEEIPYNQTEEAEIINDNHKPSFIDKCNNAKKYLFKHSIPKSDETYYKILGDFGCTQENEITKIGDQQKFLQALKDQMKDTAEQYNAAQKEQKEEPVEAEESDLPF